MVDQSIQPKPEEHFPLLKVDGGGDMNSRQPNQTLGANWEVTCTKKPYWLSRWPEFMSACWMTLILFGISFLVFYAIGMGAYRRQQFIIIKCNTSKPASNVFYHNIIPRGGQIPFIHYIDYLADMAINYPLLRVNVFFLVDDSYTSIPRGLKHGRFINKLIPIYHYGTNYKIEELDKQAIEDFQKRYQNVNVSIVPLSKFMAMTPLRYKWKTIPPSYLPYYARVFSVWENGGIGIDLNTFNNHFKNHHPINRKIKAILKQHNDGIDAENYVHALNKIDTEDQNALMSILYGSFDTLLKEWRSFFNKTINYTFSFMNKDNSIHDPLVRTHRAKRDISIHNQNLTNVIDNNNTLPNADVNSTNKENVKNNNGIQNKHNIMTAYEKPRNGSNDSTIVAYALASPQVELIYDFSISSDIGPPYRLSDPVVVNFGPMKRRNDINIAPKLNKGVQRLLSMDFDGTFIAVSSRFHPFLGHIISAGCQRMMPEIAVSDAILTLCSNIFKNDIYCNNIYFI